MSLPEMLRALTAFHLIKFLNLIKLEAFLTEGGVGAGPAAASSQGSLGLICLVLLCLALEDPGHVLAVCFAEAKHLGLSHTVH